MRRRLWWLRCKRGRSTWSKAKDGTHPPCIHPLGLSSQWRLQPRAWMTCKFVVFVITPIVDYYTTSWPDLSAVCHGIYMHRMHIHDVARPEIAYICTHHASKNLQSKIRAIREVATKRNECLAHVSLPVTRKNRNGACLDQRPSSSDPLFPPARNALAWDVLEVGTETNPVVITGV